MSVSLSKIQTAVDGLFERVLRRILPGRYPLHPIFVEKAIEKAIIDNTKVFKRGVLPPSRLEVLMNEDDYADFRKIEGLYKRQLEETAHSFIENEFKSQVIGTVKPTISVKAATEVLKGTVVVRAEHLEES